MQEEEKLLRDLLNKVAKSAAEVWCEICSGRVGMSEDCLISIKYACISMQHDVEGVASAKAESEKELDVSHALQVTR